MAVGGLPDGMLPGLACSGGYTEAYKYILSGYTFFGEKAGLKIELDFLSSMSYSAGSSS